MIVGVMPASFGFPEHERVWLPLTFGAGADPKHSLEAVGRLRGGTSIEAANAELASLAPAVEGRVSGRQEHRAHGPVVHRTEGARPDSEHVLDDARSSIWRVADRVRERREPATRARGRSHTRSRDSLALGAGRGRIVRQFLVEGLLLSAAGGLLGLAIAKVGLALVWQGVADPTTPFWIRFDIDVRVLLFTTMLSVFAASRPHSSPPCARRAADPMTC
jgi:hypothetical protein